MPGYRWTGTHAFRDHANDRVIDPGEQLPEDVADQVAAAHPHRVEAIDDEGGDEDESETESVSWDESDAPFDPDDFSVTNLDETLDEGNYSTAELSALAAVERNGENRTTALDAIEEARE